MSFVAGSSYVETLNWMAAHVRIQRTKPQSVLRLREQGKPTEEKERRLATNFDKLTQSITEEISFENKEEDVIKQSTTDEIKLANKEKDAMLEDNLKVRVGELGARLMDFMNMFLQYHCQSQ